MTVRLKRRNICFILREVTGAYLIFIYAFGLHCKPSGISSLWRSAFTSSSFAYPQFLSRECLEETVPPCTPGISWKCYSAKLARSAMSLLTSRECLEETVPPCTPGISWKCYSAKLARSAMSLLTSRECFAFSIREFWSVTH